MDKWTDKRVSKRVSQFLDHVADHFGVDCCEDARKAFSGSRDDLNRYLASDRFRGRVDWIPDHIRPDHIRKR